MNNTRTAADYALRAAGVDLSSSTTHSPFMNAPKKDSSTVQFLLAIAAAVAAIAVIGVLVVGPGFSGIGDMLDKFTGKATSQSAGSTASGTGSPTTDPSTLAVAAEGSKDGYTRAKFGSAWTDKVDVEGGHNGCNTRDDILRRDLTGITLNGSCEVTSGTLADPYTGRVINFKRGKETSSAVQIDHIVALGNVWVSGGSQLDTKTRTQVANDPLNLIAADGPANMGKGDKAADKWLPANPAFQCTYVKRQVQVKNKYRLTVTASEKAVMQKFAGRC